MRTDYICVIWSRIRIKGEVRANQIDLSPPIVFLLAVLCCASVVSYVTFVLSIFVPHLSFF